MDALPRWSADFRARCERYEAQWGGRPSHEGAVERAMVPGDTHLEARISLARIATEATLCLVLAQRDGPDAVVQLRRSKGGATIDSLAGALGQSAADRGRLRHPLAWDELRANILRPLQTYGNQASHHNAPLPEEAWPAVMAHLGELQAWAWAELDIAPVAIVAPKAPSRRPLVLGLLVAAMVLLGLITGLMLALSSDGDRPGLLGPRAAGEAAPVRREPRPKGGSPSTPPARTPRQGPEG